MTELRLGVNLWSQSTDWPSFERAARRVDAVGYDHLWTWDHLYAIFGDPLQPLFEGWTTLAAWAKVTRRTRLGLMVGANTFRSPALVAKLAATLDHISEGRAILGIGGAWFEREHRAYGLDFGTSFGQRLDWLDESVSVLRRLLAGQTVDHAGPSYRFEELRLTPPPLQRRLPIMIGGSGERQTLRTVARYADMWNGFGDVTTLRHKAEVLLRHCDAVGRDPAEIEFTVTCKPIVRDSAADARRLLIEQMAHNRTPMERIDADASVLAGTPDQLAERFLFFRNAGFGTVVCEMAAPYDEESLVRLIGEVKPMVDRA